VGIPTRLLNAALMVAPQAVDEIINAKMMDTPLEKAPECNTDDKLKAYDFEENDLVIVDAGYAIIDGIAVIEISGGLTYRAYCWWTTSYLDIRDSFRAAIADERVNSVLFLIDSPGGEVAGLFDLVDEIYHARGTKPIIAVADETAFSAAYAIASAADEVYLSRTAEVGSIGVIAIHTDQSGFDKNLGVKYTPIYAGDRKNDFNPHEPLKADAREVLKVHVDKLYDMLTAVIARNRSMSQAAVIATQSGFYMGAAAVDAGLADGVLSAKDTVTRMSSSKGDMAMNLNEVKDFITQALAESLAEVKTMIEKQNVALAEQSHALDGIEARLMNELLPASDPTNATDADSATTIAGDIVEMCDIAGMPELAGAMIRDGLTFDEAKSAILDAKAKAAEKAPIISTVGPLSTGESNPLLEDAKKRAKKADNR